MTSRRKWWIGGLSSLVLAFGIVSLSVPAGFGLLAFGDIAQFLLLFAAFVLMTVNAVSSRGQIRLFWGLMAAGCLLWSTNLSLWTVYEVILRRSLPEPFIGDVILFVHVVPFMAAVALRPHLSEAKKVYFSTLNFLVLLVWWVFLYAYIVFPDEFVVLNVAVYSPHFDLLYLVENLALLGHSAFWDGIHAAPGSRFTGTSLSLPDFTLQAPWPRMPPSLAINITPAASTTFPSSLPFAG